MRCKQRNNLGNNTDTQTHTHTHTHTNITGYLLFLTVQFRLILHSDLWQHLQELRKSETPQVYLRSAQPHCSLKSGREETSIFMFLCSTQQDTLIPTFGLFLLPKKIFHKRNVVQHSFIQKVESVIQFMKQHRMHPCFATATLGTQTSQHFALYVRRIYC